MEEPPFSLATIEVYHQLKVSASSLSIVELSVADLIISLKIYSSCRN
jgi:hypothetical protein